MPHVPRHISDISCCNTSHLGPLYSTSDTLHHSLPPTTISHHHFSKRDIIHITRLQSTSHTIPHPQLFHTIPTFNISTFHTTPYSRSHYTTTSDSNTLHHFPHLTSHNKHTAHCTFFITTIPHHHISHQITTTSAHHSTSRPHTLHITTFKYKLHLALSHSTHSKPHHTSHTAFQPSFRITPCV